ncbi:MAG: recombinase family protein [Bacillota bacterium]
MRAAVYVRVSTEEQATLGYSLAEQKHACISRARELGATSIQVYADEGVSGATLDRSGLAALRNGVSLGEFDVVVCRDPDRLSRKLAHQLLLTEEFERAGVRLEFISFDWKDTPEGRLFYAVRGAISEYEREKIRERTALGKLQKARQGGVPVRFDVYGYEYDPQTGQVRVREDEAAVVREIFERFVGGWGYNTIARWLNELGIPTRRSRNCWHRQVIAQVIANTAYAGTWYYGKKTYGVGKRGRPVQRDQWIPISVPPVVDQDLWQAAQLKAQQARRLWANRGRHDYLLSGIVTCGDCALPMSGTWIGFWGKHDRYYTCGRNLEGPTHKGCRPRKFVPAAQLEEAVWAQVKSWLSDPEVVVAEALRCGWETESLSQELARVEGLLAELEKGRQNVLAALARGLLELDVTTETALLQLKRRMEALSQRKREIQAQMTQGAGTGYSLESVRSAAQRLLSQIDSWPFLERRDLVRTLVRQVIVHGRTGNIVLTVVPWRLGDGITSLTRCE